MPRKTRTRARSAMTLFALLVVLSLHILPDRFPWPLGLTASAAATLTVNSTGDGGDSDTGDGVCNDGTGACTLRAAIQQANAAGGDTINFSLPPGSVITLTGTELTIDKSLTIVGPGAQLLSVSGNNASRVFLVNAGTSRISGLTITAGSATSGAGITNINPAALTLDGCHIFDNTATSGGGGIGNSGALNINNSTISHNESSTIGGGLSTAASTVITNSTFSNNTAASGGGISNVGTLTLNSVTIAANTATNSGGGILTPGIGPSTMANTLIADNTATNSSPDCSGANINSQDYNLIENPSGCSLFGATTHNITGVDPLLGPLQNNGGPTPTRALLAGSPAIDQGNTALTTDQRGLPRPVDLPVANAAGGNASDIGAFEAQGPPRLVISEFRARGPNGAGDEFVEIFNGGDAPLTVTPPDGSAGYALVVSDGVARFTIPSGTVIPVRGHYLGTNVGYGLDAYATGDTTYETDIADNAGIALFETANAASFTLANRLDAAGSTSEANALYREGAGYAPVNVLDAQYSLLRDLSAARPKDTQDNQADFRVVSPTVVVRADATYGYPGPENLGSPVERNANMPLGLVDPSQAPSAPPNRVRDVNATSSPCSTFGTLSIRRTVTNNTGAPITRLRFRAVNITTAPAPAGVADLRPITSSETMVTVGGVPRTILGTTLETAGGALPNNCGGLNSTLAVGPVTPAPAATGPSAGGDIITLAAPLPNGQSVDVQLLLGVQQNGAFRFFINVEVLNDSPVSNSTTRARASAGESGETGKKRIVQTPGLPPPSRVPAPKANREADGPELKRPARFKLRGEYDLR